MGEMEFCLDIMLYHLIRARSALELIHAMTLPTPSSFSLSPNSSPGSQPQCCHEHTILDVFLGEHDLFDGSGSRTR